MRMDAQKDDCGYTFLQQLPFMDSIGLSKMLQIQPDLLTIKHDGKSALHHAVLSGNLAAVEAILRSDGFSDEADLSGQTPLLAACSEGQLWTMDQLVARGADPGVADARGVGCVHLAAESGQLTALQYLHCVLEAPLTQQDAAGRTPLMLAAAAGHAATVRHLIHMSRPSLTATDCRGETALHHAARGGHVHVCWLLVTLGDADLLTLASGDGRTPHQVAALLRSPCTRFLSTAHACHASGRALPTARPASLWALARPAVTYVSALLLCALVPRDWAPLLNPAVMVACLLTLRGQSHRLDHPSRLPSPFAVGAVCALTGTTVIVASVDMRIGSFTPLYVLLPSLCLPIGFLFWYSEAIRSDPGAVPPTTDVAATLKNAASTMTGQHSYCAACRVWRAESDHHCRLCQRCYLGHDHHCLYMANCVAAGNRLQYLRALLLAAACCVGFLAYVYAYLLSLSPARWWLWHLLGRYIDVASCAAAHAAALLLLRSLLAHEMRRLWSAMDGSRYRKARRIMRYVAKGVPIHTADSVVV